MTGHRVLIAPAAYGFARVVCFTPGCLWVGPERQLDDPHFVGLVDDDRDWHDEQVSGG